MARPAASPKRGPTTRLCRGGLIAPNVSVHEAWTHLSRRIEQVLAFNEIVISRNKEPAVRLVRERPSGKKPPLSDEDAHSCGADAHHLAIIH